MKPRMMVLSAVLAVAPIGALADIVHLNNGTTIEGTLKRDVGGWIVTGADGRATHLADSAVKSIQKTSNLSPEALAESKVAAVRRVVDAMDDPKQAMGRYEAFIQQNKGTPAAALAEKELAVWKERLEKNMKKMGGAWVTPEQFSEAMGKAVAAIEGIRSDIKAGRYKEADAALDQMLAGDKTNVSALYLKGVIAARQEQLGVAKRFFENVRDGLANHGPTLNNLAAVHWKQKQTVPAVSLYDLALQAEPRNRTILNNVAEVLHALPENERQHTVAKRLEKRFAEQDAVLQKELAVDGLFRWGATYIDKAQKEEIEKAQQKVKERLDLLAKDYGRLNDRLQSIDRLIERNEDSMERIQRQRSFTDPTSGVAVIRPMPPEYYDLKRENDRLEVEREGLIPKLDEFRAKAMAVQQELPQPPYGGKQEFFDVEGTPLGK